MRRRDIKREQSTLTSAAMALYVSAKALSPGNDERRHEVPRPDEDKRRGERRGCPGIPGDCSCSMLKDKDRRKGRSGLDKPSMA